jgi:hypothetical protein
MSKDEIINNLLDRCCISCQTSDESLGRVYIPEQDKCIAICIECLMGLYKNDEQEPDKDCIIISFATPDDPTEEKMIWVRFTEGVG